MTTKDHLINQHILEYESRLKHIDELLSQANHNTNSADSGADKNNTLEDIKQKRNELEQHIHRIKTMSVDNWEKDAIRMAGPMAVWDAVAQQVEKLIEK